MKSIFKSLIGIILISSVYIQKANGTEENSSTKEPENSSVKIERLIINDSLRLSYNKTDNWSSKIQNHIMVFTNQATGAFFQLQPQDLKYCLNGIFEDAMYVDSMFQIINNLTTKEAGKNGRFRMRISHPNVQENKQDYSVSGHIIFHSASYELSGTLFKRSDLIDFNNIVDSFSCTLTN